MKRSVGIGAYLAVLIALFSQAALAEQRFNQVALRAEVSQSVAHDEMQVTLFSEAQDTDPAKLARQISQSLNAAVARARNAEPVRVSLGSRHSFPVYDEKGQTITAWRERAELRLESSDFAALSELTAGLLGNLKMGGMSFSMASSTRKQAEDALLKEAIRAFNERASLVSQAMGGVGFRLVSLNLNSGGFQRPMPMRMEAMKGMAMADAAAPQEIEAGSSEVTVSADGVIEVQMP